jgi:hypothetical protein
MIDKYSDAMCSKFWTKMELIAFHSLTFLVRWAGINEPIDMRCFFLKHIYYEHIFLFLIIDIAAGAILVMTVPSHMRPPPLSPSLGQYIHFLGYFLSCPY